MRVSRRLEDVRAVVAARHGLDHQAVEQLGVVGLLLLLGHGVGAGASVVHGSTRGLGWCGGCTGSLVLVGFFEEVHCWSVCVCFVRVRVRAVEADVLWFFVGRKVRWNEDSSWALFIRCWPLSGTSPGTCFFVRSVGAGSLKSFPKLEVLVS